MPVYVPRAVRANHRAGEPKRRFTPAFGTPDGAIKDGYEDVPSYVEYRLDSTGQPRPVVIQSYRRRNGPDVPYVHHDLFGANQPDRYRRHYRTVHRAYRNLHLNEINADVTPEGRYLKRFLNRERNAGIAPPLPNQHPLGNVQNNNNHALHVPLAHDAAIHDNGIFEFDEHNIPDAHGEYPLPAVAGEELEENPYQLEMLLGEMAE